MKKRLLSIVAAVFIGSSVIAQAPNLGTAISFSLFTAAGDFGNTGITSIAGDIGTEAGNLTGFPPGVLTGGIQVENGITEQAAADVSAAYSFLSGVTCEATLTSPLGNGQILTPNTYCIGEATTLEGSLILDGEGDPDALFIIQINGGALSTAALSSVTLTNGTRWENVYWKIGGQFSIGEGATFRGTALVDGAINLLDGARLIGRALTVAGAINLLNNSVVFVENPLPVTLVKFSVNKGEERSIQLSWLTTSEVRSDRFELERSADGKSWSQLAVVSAQGTSSSLVFYAYTDSRPVKGVNLYRLKMIDLDATYSYSVIRSIQIQDLERMVFYPNPTRDRVLIDLADLSQVERIQINDLRGKVVYDQPRKEWVGGAVNMQHLTSGTYVFRFIHSDGRVASVKIVKN